MNDDMADGQLIDVNGVSLQELLDEVDGDGVRSALDGILASQHDGGRYAFTSSI